jgi:EVE domain
VDSGIYAFGERTPGRGKLKPGDWMCFYASGKGVVAHARVSSMPEKKPHQKVRHSDKYPWVFRLTQAVLYPDKPMVIDLETRTRLDAFKNRDPNKSWAWFVQGTHAITEHDFHTLTRQ